MNSESSHSNCGEFRRHLEMYFDGELRDAPIAGRIDKHIHACPACREQLHVLASTREQLRSLPRIEAPPYVHKRVREIVTGNHGGWVKRISVLARDWRFSTAAAAAMLLALGASLYFGPGPASRIPVRAFVDDHLAYIQAAADHEVATSNPEELEAWLEAQLNFSPSLPRWEWAALQSGRPCSIGGRRVAFIRYRCGGEDLSLFIRPLDTQGATDLDGAAPRLSGSAQGHTVAVWRRSGQEYVLVTPTAMEDILTRLENSV